MLDDPEQLTVSQRLGAGRTHVRRFRIEAPTDLRLTAAVIGVARGTVIGEMLKGLPQHSSVGCTGFDRARTA
jgi:hypothetical protein